MDWKNHLEKNPIQKIEKTVNIKVKLPHVNKKPLPIKQIFVQTPYSHSTLKLERKNFTPQNHSLFRSTSCFGVTKITTPIWLQKSWKCVNRSLKKRQRPNTIQILWIVKNQEKANNSPSYRCAAIKKKIKDNLLDTAHERKTDSHVSRQANNTCRCSWSCISESHHCLSTQSAS